VGTFGGALEARSIDASGGRLVGEITGEMEVEGGVLLVKRIHAHYKLRAAAEHRETIERVHGFHQDRCPVARSIKGAIEVTTSYELVA
jgi:uncharacterized OsmC-like protein